MACAHVAELLSIDPGLDDVWGVCYRAVLDLVNMLPVVLLHGEGTTALQTHRFESRTTTTFIWKCYIFSVALDAPRLDPMRGLVTLARSIELCHKQGEAGVLGGLRTYVLEGIQFALALVGWSHGCWVVVFPQLRLLLLVALLVGNLEGTATLLW